MRPPIGPDETIQAGRSSRAFSQFFKTFANKIMVILGHVPACMQCCRILSKITAPNSPLTAENLKKGLELAQGAIVSIGHSRNAWQANG